MSRTLIHVDHRAAGSHAFRARVIEHKAQETQWYQYEAHVTAHIDIDDVALTMTVEQAAALCDVLAVALAEHNQRAAAAA